MTLKTTKTKVYYTNTNEMHLLADAFSEGIVESFPLHTQQGKVSTEPKSKKVDTLTRYLVCGYIQEKKEATFEYVAWETFIEYSQVLELIDNLANRYSKEIVFKGNIILPYSYCISTIKINPLEQTTAFLKDIYIFNINKQVEKVYINGPKKKPLPPKLTKHYANANNL